MRLWVVLLVCGVVACGGAEPVDDLGPGGSRVSPPVDPGPAASRVRAPVFEGDEVWNAHHASRVVYLDLVGEARDQAISELARRWPGTEVPSGGIRCPAGPEALPCGCLDVFKRSMNGLWVRVNTSLFVESQRRRGGSWSPSDVRELNLEGTRASVAAFWADRENWERDAGRSFLPRLCGWEAPRTYR